MTVVDLLAESGLASSKGEARRQLKQGGISINGSKVAGDGPVELDQLLAERFLWLRRGKKTDVIVAVDS
jgi:tyrosyl-tRNA synthetase